MHPFGLTTIAFAGLLVAGTGTHTADVTAITTDGKGDLTMCPYTGCNLYHHVRLPHRIAIGDSVRLHFGSNPKDYNFPIARIVQDAGVCTVYSQLTETEDVENIVIASCQATSAQ